MKCYGSQNRLPALPVTDPRQSVRIRAIRRALFVLVLTLPMARAAHAEPIDVWLDVDPAIGMIEKDVDDGLAMIQAFHSPELRIRGVSVNFGNSPLERGYPIAQDVVARFGPEDLPVHSGAASPDDLGKQTDAVDAMAAALAERPLTLLALGPVTNVATLIQKHPGLHDRIEAIVMVAARRPGQIFRPKPESERQFPDFNFESDPRAMEVLLQSAVPLVFAPWEVSSHVWITNANLETLRGSGESGAYIADKSRSWIRMWKRMSDTDGFNPFDTLAIGYLTHPETIQSEEVSVWIDWREGQIDPEGEPVPPHLIADKDAEGGRRAIYCYEPTADFKPMLMERLSSPAGVE